MKQFSITFLLIMLMSMVGTKASAYDFEVDEVYYTVVSIEDLTCAIAPRYYDASNYSGDFIIPKEVQYKGRTFKVIKIDANAFLKSSVSSVTIPEGITAIGNYAFSQCKKIVSMQLPSTVTSIGSGSFLDCTSLASITLPKSINTIGGRAFSGCTSLTHISIPNGIPSISEETFKGCTSLVDISIPQSVKEIGKSAFEDCTALKDFTVPSSCDYIRDYAFIGCNKLKKLIIEDNTTPILLGSSNDYYYIDLFTSNDKFSLDTLYLGRIAKRNEHTKQFVDRNGMFGDKLKSVTIGNMVTDEIYNSEERYLFGLPLRHITFGNGITRIPNMSKYSSLDSIVVLNEIPPSAGGFTNRTYLYCMLYVPKGCKSAYESADVWKNFWNIMELEQDLSTLNIKTYNESTEKCEMSRFSVDGKRINVPQKGINIVKMSDGTVKKIVVK